jgi:hypothetical protein
MIRQSSASADSGRASATGGRSFAKGNAVGERLAQLGGRRVSRINQGIAGSQDGFELDSANLLLAAYYRCPMGQVPFRQPADSVESPGYFRLGSDTICYGLLSSGQTSASPLEQLPDAMAGVEFGADGVKLPFDAGMLVENLCRERYTAHFRKEGRVFNDFLRKAYYLIRPLLGMSARRQIQKIRRRGWDEIRFPSWPVDTTLERFHQRLLALSLKAQGLEKIPFIWFWPEGFSSCAIMTHDVEGQSGRDFCPALMDLDELFGIRSSFQIVPESRYAVSRSFLDAIRSRGFEVNVHDLRHDGRLYADRAEFLRRAERINHYAREYDARGFRSGILYRNADWYDAFEFSYDMSIPNVAHLDPQRGGCCTVMPYFIGNIVELPVTCTQDYTLFHILGEYSTELWDRQIALVREQHGLISFIVHPDYIVERRARDTYKALLGRLSHLSSEGRIWTALPRDVAAWWRARSKMELIYEDGEWRVEGPGSEQARVAYASLAGDAVTYGLPC